MRLILAALVFAVPLVGSTGELPPGAKLVVVCADTPSSRALASRYAAARGVDDSSIIAFEVPAEETIDRASFVAKVANPLLAELVARGRVRGSLSPLVDDFGRRRFLLDSHDIDFLVVMRGVPLRVAEDEASRAKEPAERLPEPFRVNRAAVDAELAVLLAGGAPLVGPLPNPWFRGSQRLGQGAPRAAVLRVSRLDGPSDAAVRGMIDGALAAEREGLAGRAYVDLGGPFPQGDAWLEQVAKAMRGAGREVVEQRLPTVISPGDRADSAAIYFGWYTGEFAGPFALPGYRFPRGAVAVHLHSFSAETLRDPRRTWAGPLVAKGVAATVGNVYEPYLEFSHHLGILGEDLAAGRSFGEAAWAAMPAVSWHAIAIGDPLYRPFAVGPDELRKRAAERDLPAGQAEGLRILAIAETPSERVAAEREATRILLRNPGLPLALALAEAAERRGDRAAALEQLELLRYLTLFPVDEWAAVAEAVARLEAWGEREFAAEVRARLVAQPGMPPELAAIWQGGPPQPAASPEGTVLPDIADIKP